MPPLLTLQLLPPLPSSGHVDKVREQLKMGANVNTRDNASWTPLVRHRTTHGQQQVAAMSYARLATQLPDCPPESQHEACAGGFTEIVELLLDAGADVNATASDDITPLHDAATEGFIDIAKVRVEGCWREDWGRPQSSRISGRAQSSRVPCPGQSSFSSPQLFFPDAPGKGRQRRCA